MVKAALAVAAFSLFLLPARAAEITYEAKPDGIEFVLNFTRGYSNLDVLKSDKTVVVSFETTEKLNFQRQDFFDLPLTSAYLISDSSRKKLVVDFNGEIIEPAVSESGRKITVAFPFRTATDEAAPPAAEERNVSAGTSSLPSAGAYFRMMMGLGVVLMIILLGYWLVKSYFKKRVFTDIPGSGRLLGKVDLDMRKTLFFYELGDIIYIIGITDAGMCLIDKISDETEATKIRGGFTRKSEFNGYMSFFKRKNELDDDMSVSKTIVEEKLKSLRKKN